MGLIFKIINEVMSNQNNDNKNKSEKITGIHDDYEDKEKEKLIKEGKYDEFNFEEEELEEDDYYYEDDK